MLTTWETYNLPKEIVKKELCRSTFKRNGVVFGVYYQRNHKKKFYYKKRNDNEREIAKNKAIKLIKLAYWKKMYITDFPAPTPEFIQLIQKLDFGKVYDALNKIEIINSLIIDAKKNRYYSDISPSPELVQVVNDQLNIVIEQKAALPVYAYLWTIKHKIHEIFYLSLESILDDKNSNFKPDSRGRERFVPKDLERYIIERDNGLCLHCGIMPDPEVTRIDHVIPVTLGGPSAKWNLQLLCRNCNQRKLHILITDDIKRALLRLKTYIS